MFDALTRDRTKDRLGVKGLLVAALIATSPEAGSDSLATLRATLGEAITLTSSPVELRYCPDNTCEAFQAADASACADFALLYLYQVSSYAYLESWRAGIGQAAVRGVVDRHRGVCGDGYGVAPATCVLAGMKEQYSVEVFILRYDEGVLSREPASGLPEND